MFNQKKDVSNIRIAYHIRGFAVGFGATLCNYQNKKKPFRQSL